MSDVVMFKSLPADIAAAIVAGANRNGVDPCLLAALAAHESSLNTWAMRFEHALPYLWNVQAKKPYRAQSGASVAPPDFTAPPGVSRDTEFSAQKTSLGLCQIMGATARSIGFAGQYLTELCDPLVGAEYGAKYLAGLLKKYDVGPAISAYNAGQPTEANQSSYVDPILRQRDLYRQDGF